MLGLFVPVEIVLSREHLFTDLARNLFLLAVSLHVFAHVSLSRHRPRAFRANDWLLVGSNVFP